MSLRVLTKADHSPTDPFRIAIWGGFEMSRSIYFIDTIIENINFIN